MSFVGDIGREMYLTFYRGTVQVGSGESAQSYLISRYPDLQRAFGAMPGAYSIKIDPACSAWALQATRNTPS